MEEYQLLLDAVRQNFASVVWTHKIQEKQADIYADRYRKMETINIILSAATTCGIIALFSEDWVIIKVLTAVLSFGSLAINAYFKSFDLKVLEKQHKDAANNFIVIRNELLLIISDLHRMRKSVTEISDKYEQIMEKLNDLYITAPSTTNKAVEKASEALNVNNEYTYTEEEIDKFLPVTLRGKIKGNKECQ